MRKVLDSHTSFALGRTIVEEPSSPFDTTDESSQLTGSPYSVEKGAVSHADVERDGEPSSHSHGLPSAHVLCDDELEGRDKGGDASVDQNQAAESLVDDLNHLFGSPRRALSSEECMVGLDVDGVATGDPSTKNVDGAARWPMIQEDWSSRRAEQGSAYLGERGVEPTLEPVLEGVLLEAGDPAVASRSSLSTQRMMERESSATWSDHSSESGRQLSPMRELTFDTSKDQSKMSLLSEPSSGRSARVVNFDDPEDGEIEPAGIRRQDSSSRLSVHSDTSAKSSSRSSVLRSSISTGSRAVVMTSRKAGSGLISAGSSVVKGSVAASQTIAKGSRAASQNFVDGSKEVSKSIAKGSRVATSAIKKVAKDTSMDKVLESVGETGIKTIKTTTSIANHVVTSAATVVPILANNASGSARDAGFVVFTNLFTTQAALQMIHHPKVRHGT